MMTLCTGFKQQNFASYNKISPNEEEEQKKEIIFFFQSPLMSMSIAGEAAQD